MIEKEENEFNEKINNDDDKNQIIDLNGNNNNINKINLELNKEENYEGKGIIINNIIKEDNNKENHNIQKKKELDNIEHNNYKEYSIDDLKKRKKAIEKLFKNLCKDIIGNKEMSDLNINVIYSKEIIQNKDSVDLKRIFLMDEESSKKFQTFINYKKLNQFIFVDDKSKDKLIEKYHEEYNRIYNILNGKIELPNEIKL